MGGNTTTGDNARYPQPKKDPVLERQPNGRVLLLFGSHDQCKEDVYFWEKTPGARVVGVIILVL